MNLLTTLSLFSTLAIGTIPAYLIAKAQKTNRKGQGEFQMAITSDSVRERSSRDLRTAKEARSSKGKASEATVG
jgi:hypothetical protein